MNIYILSRIELNKDLKRKHSRLQYLGKRLKITVRNRDVSDPLCTQVSCQCVRRDVFPQRDSIHHIRLTSNTLQEILTTPSSAPPYHPILPSLHGSCFTVCWVTYLSPSHGDILSGRYCIPPDSLLILQSVIALKKLWVSGRMDGSVDNLINLLPLLCPTEFTICFFFCFSEWSMVILCFPPKEPLTHF